MSPPGPIYASTLHRRDRTWTRRSALRARTLLWAATGTVVAAGLLAHFS